MCLVARCRTEIAAAPGVGHRCATCGGRAFGQWRLDVWAYPPGIAASSRKARRGSAVVCLACGKQFSYDLKEMRIGKPLPSSADFGVLPPGMPGLRKSKIKLALGIGVPLGIVIGSALSSRRKPASQQPDTERNKPAKPGSEAPS